MKAATIAKLIAAAATMLILAGALFIFYARTGRLTPNDATLRARYALPQSKFVEIDGEPIHYVDEGRGTPVLLLHGSFGSLRMWEEWAKVLVPHYRVVRFDLPPMGLSGPDPGGRYDTAREMQLIGRLSATLGLRPMILVATSSAGVAAAAYAAQHPEQVEALILANVAVGTFHIDRDRLSTSFRWVLAIDPIFGGWHPRELWRQVLRANVEDPGKVTPALIAEWTDLNNRAQRMPAAKDSPDLNALLARTPDDLPHIRAPTLLLWSADDHELPVAVGEHALTLLGADDKSLLVVPNCGHIMPIDCGAKSAAIALPFLDRVAAPRTAP